MGWKEKIAKHKIEENNESEKKKEKLEERLKEKRVQEYPRLFDAFNKLGCLRMLRQIRNEVWGCVGDIKVSPSDLDSAVNRWPLIEKHGLSVTLSVPAAVIKVDEWGKVESARLYDTRELIICAFIKDDEIYIKVNSPFRRSSDIPVTLLSDTTSQWLEEQLIKDCVEREGEIPNYLEMTAKALRSFAKAKGKMGRASIRDN